MNYRLLFAIIALLVILLASFLFFFAFLSYFVFKDQQSIYFVTSACISMTLGVITFLFTGKPNHNLVTHREGLGVAGLGWVFIAFFGCLPFYLSNAIPNFTDAYFESISGFTTTGASILINIQAQPKSILLWRSFTQWLGGMGIIVLTISILPTLRIGGMQLFMAEVAGPNPDKITPRVSETAKKLYLVYTMLTLTQTCFLYFGGMSLFESICHSFTTIATGGFSPLNNSIGSYYLSPYYTDSNYIYYEYVIITFMFVSGVNFSLHYKFIIGHLKSYVQNHEFVYYFSAIALATLFIFFNLTANNAYSNTHQTFLHSLFVSVSTITGTGFTTENFDIWPNFSIILIFFLMFFGGMGGSTTGGMKIIRLVSLSKEAFHEIRRSIHPKLIYSIRYGKTHLTHNITKSINMFLIIFILIYIIGVIILSFTKLDMKSVLSMTIACLGNVGPGLGAVGPYENFAGLPVYAKWVLCLLMLIGRLEIFPILSLFMLRLWRK